MRSFCDQLRDGCTRAISAAFPELPQEKAEVTAATAENFGHYQCNSSLKLAKLLKQSPRQVAEKIVEQLRQDVSLSAVIAKMEVAGPGFINFYLQPSSISRALQEMLTAEKLGITSPHPRQKVIVEFSSPNIAKELHVGHLRSTIIGDSLARLLEFFGDEVVRLNHVGDWGTQFGMLIAYLKQNEPQVLKGEKSADLHQLMQWYKASKKYFDTDATFKKTAQQEVVALQSGDATSKAAWERICEVSRKGFQEIYDLLGVHLVERGESFYNPQLPLVVQDLEKKGLIQVSDGAKCIFLEGYRSKEGTSLPIIVQKADGGYNYDTTDMAAIVYRVNQDRAERIIVVTDAGQSLRFEMLFKAAVKAQYYDSSKVLMQHVPFGVVLGADGKKFKTRSGETEKLIDLLHEAVDHAYEILKERELEISDAELRRMAQILGIDAVKYADLSSHRMKDYTFSYERMLKFEGNTAAFLLYAYVRIQSIKRRVMQQGNMASIEKLPEEIHVDHSSELALGLHLVRFIEALQMVEKDLLPHRLCEYLYELAEKFHAFFRDCRVEGSPEQNARLKLCQLTSLVLETGLNILGLQTLERM